MIKTKVNADAVIGITCQAHMKSWGIHGGQFGRICSSGICHHIIRLLQNMKTTTIFAVKALKCQCGWSAFSWMLAPTITSRVLLLFTTAFSVIDFQLNQCCMSRLV